MSQLRDSVDAQEGVVEVADLWRAETPDDLHRVLALYEPIRRSADSWEPFQLLVKHHVAGSEDSPVTAMLLLTDRRWSKGVGQLVRRIEEADILASEELDILAEAFVRTDQALYWAIPDNWFGEGSIVIDVGPGSPPSGDDEEPVEPSDRPALAKRDVHPPLRRWASARLVGRDPPVWGGLLTRARDLGGRAGAAVVSGLVDEMESVPLAAQRLLVEAAVGWPDQAVRLLGLGRMAEREGPRAAHDRAIRDRSARVRSWGEIIMDTLDCPEPPRDPACIHTEDAGSVPDAREAHRPGPENQARLF